MNAIEELSYDTYLLKFEFVELKLALHSAHTKY